LSGEVSFQQAWFGFSLPALIGNIIGGSRLFAVLAHGQMRSDLTEGE